MEGCLSSGCVGKANRNNSVSLAHFPCLSCRNNSNPTILIQLKDQSLNASLMLQKSNSMMLAAVFSHQIFIPSAAWPRSRKSALIEAEQAIVDTSGALLQKGQPGSMILQPPLNTSHHQPPTLAPSSAEQLHVIMAQDQDPLWAKGRANVPAARLTMRRTPLLSHQ